MEKGRIQPCTMEHVGRYAQIYAAAFSGEPWNDSWTVEDAEVHVRELLESRQSYGLEYFIGGEVVGFILGTSMLFHYGRTFEINDLAVAPEHQRQGIASDLMDACLAALKDRGIGAVGTVLIGILVFKEPASFWRLLFITTLIVSVVGLKMLQSGGIFPGIDLRDIRFSERPFFFSKRPCPWKSNGIVVALYGMVTR